MHICIFQIITMDYHRRKSMSEPVQGVKLHLVRSEQVIRLSDLRRGRVLHTGSPSLSFSLSGSLRAHTDCKGKSNMCVTNFHKCHGNYENGPGAVE